MISLPELARLEREAYARGDYRQVEILQSVTFGLALELKEKDEEIEDLRSDLAACEKRLIQFEESDEGEKNESPS